MSEPKDFVAGMGSDSRKSPVRVAFVTRRTSPHVTAHDDDTVMAFPEALFRAIVAIELLALVLVVLSLFWNAPLEELADPLLTPNPAKAPWYFLGLQELLHYFPPVVAGVLIPGLVVLALVVIPYFRINIEGEGLWKNNRSSRLRTVTAVVVLFTIFLIVFKVYVALAPTLLVAGFMFYAATNGSGPFHNKLAAKPLSFWIMSWFLFSAAVLTLVGTFFRGPGWSFVMPWSGQL
jgi:hypothetical protein